MKNLMRLALLLFPLLPVFADEPVQPSDYRGKKAVVLLFMRGSNPKFACHFCSLQTKAYKSAYEELRKLDAEVLVVLPGADDVPTYLKNVGTDEEKDSDPNFTIPFPVLLDRDFSLCKAYEVPFKPGGQPFPVSEPATVVLGKDGQVLYAYHGKNPPDRPTVETVLAVLQGKKVDPSKAEPEPAKPAGPTLPWVGYEEGMKAAKAEKKPVLLDFYGDW